MAKDKHKPSTSPAVDPLVKKIDDMMSIEKPDPVAKPEAPAKSEQALDIFKDAATAPKLPSKLLKEIEEESAKPDTKKTTVAAAAAEKPEATEETITPEPTEPVDDTEAKAVESSASDLDNPDTDKAVADIVAKEGNEVLAVEDARAKKAAQPSKKSGGWKTKLKSFFKNKWTWVGIAVVLLALFAVPTTRYRILGLVLKGTSDITVVDSKTGTPVSNAIVQIGGVTGKTDGAGSAKIKAPLGNHTLKITKQYFAPYSGSYFVGFAAAPNMKTKLVATGRQVPITVVNTITGKPLANVEIKVLNTSAKTNGQGKATIVLPAKAPSYTAKLSLNGFNTADKVPVQATDKVVSENTLKLTPSGQVYFLSDQSGKLDVVKTNLDGTSRKVVLAGTGSEDKPNTSLLASRDWRFLVLSSTRDDAKQQALYLIDTSNDEVAKFESNNATFRLIGWSGHNFLYHSLSNTKNTGDAGREAIKSYDADNRQINQLVQNQVDESQSAYQFFSDYYLLGKEVVYTSSWAHVNLAQTDLSSHKNSITGIGLNGQNQHDYDAFAAGQGYYTTIPYEPEGIYFSKYIYTESAYSYHKIEDGKATDDPSLTAADFNKTYPTFLQSPSGTQQFWTEFRDGKNTLFLGNEDAENQKQIATLSDYSPYGWHSDKYLLVSKNSSELYILPAGPLSTSQPPLKISDYYKPQLTYRGYGGGYGGL